MNQIEKAVKVLKKGGVIAFPTETVYGLGANIFDEKAVRKVFQLKGRDFKKPLSVAVSDFEMLQKLARVSEKQKKLLKKLLPGPVTVILPKKKLISSLITGGSKFVGIRFPKNKITLKIIKKAGFPITATSANLNGEKEVFRAKDIKLKVDFLVKGSCRYKIPSTVVDLVNKEIIRKGNELEKVKEILKERLS
ncbi:MAG: L-threonylcarbamoyladenylate synthase [Patescibacteria group bacterium]|nr:L-threonylcarbamoyladenylate synthase [Patescibacteria group bacterium]